MGGSKVAKDYFLKLAKDKAFIKGTAANLIELLDKTKSQTLNEDEITDLMKVIVRKGARDTLGYAAAFVPVESTARGAYKDLIVPNTRSLDKCASKWDVSLLLRTSLLCAAGAVTQAESTELARYMGKTNKIDYDLVNLKYLRKAPKPEESGKPEVLVKV